MEAFQSNSREIYNLKQVDWLNMGSIMIVGKPESRPSDGGKLLRGSVAIASIALFGALIIQGFIPILIRLNESSLDPNAIIFNHFWMALAFLGLGNALQSIFYRPSDCQSIEESVYTSRVLWLLMAMGVCGAGSLIFWSWSLTQTQVATSALAFGMTPLFTTLLDWLIWGKIFSTKFGIGMAIAIGGTCILGALDFSDSTLHLQGDGIALLASICYAFYLLFTEKLRPQLTATTIFYWRYAIGLLLTLPLILIDNAPIFPSSSLGWFFLIGLSVVSLGQILVIYSLKQFPSGLVALVLLLDPAFTAILAWMIFGENLSLLNWMVFALILLGICISISSQVASDRDNELSLSLLQ